MGAKKLARICGNTLNTKYSLKKCPKSSKMAKIGTFSLISIRTCYFRGSSFNKMSQYLFNSVKILFKIAGGRKSGKPCTFNNL